MDMFCDSFNGNVCVHLKNGQQTALGGTSHSYLLRPCINSCAYLTVSMA